MIVIIDDFLSDYDVETVHRHFSLVKVKEWIETNTTMIGQSDSPFASILKEANKYFDLSSMVGCEVWSHSTTRPDWHYDKDETHNEQTGNLKFPLCGIVYYPHVSNLTGGRLLTGTEQIVPKRNRLIIFSPGILHSVEPYTGERMSVAINPWNYKIV